MTEAEFRKHLDAAEKSPKQIAAAVSGLPDKTLRYKPAPDKWCILEILAHLADIEILYAHRIRQMLADKAGDRAYRPGRLGQKSRLYVRICARVGCALRAEPAHTLQLLRRIKLADLEKTAFHPELQKNVTVAEYVDRIGTHGANHLQQIERL